MKIKKFPVKHILRLYFQLRISLIDGNGYDISTFTCILQLFERVRAHTVEEIDEAIHEQEARADSLYQTDERVITVL